jgi:AcrR family transcriptional regulator
MALINEDAAAEVIGGMKAARSAAYEQLGRGKTRLRSTSKTRKSRETRQRIMDAASRLIIRHRSVLFQMREVSDLCGMSKGSLYYYFSDRDELIAAVFDESIDELVKQIESVAARAESARAAIRGLYGEFARRLREGSVLALAMTHEISGGGNLGEPDMTSRLSRVAEVIAAQLERAKAEGVVRVDVDSSTAATYAIGGFLATAMVVARKSGDIDTDALVQGLMDMTFAGVGLPGVSLD